ncbi:MAG: polysaccharide pyruvyl transferase family protein [Acidobacteria bacterium]|nr:polysaccharide pyruvyl transferase family protein [Acidobacteriota bacterium]
MRLFSRAKEVVPLWVRTRLVYGASRPDRDLYKHLRGKRKIVVALAADYPNLGDIAITHAHTEFVRACLPGWEIVDFPCAATYLQLKALKRVCTPDDIITITGGGNMGDAYASIEDARRFLISRFPRNRVVSFPQTADFADTATGRRELRRSQRAYGRHRNLHLFARERVSFELMQRYFPGVRVDLVPDTVLSMPVCSGGAPREGVLVCLRSDCESALGVGGRADLLADLAERIPGIRMTDTVLARTDRLSLDERSRELEALLATFQAAEAVVTDRLHGMILAAITGTPCVVMQSSNHKIAATHRAWLAGNPAIALLEDHSAASVLAALEQVCTHAPSGTGDLGLSGAFEPLRHAVTGGLR